MDTILALMMDPNAWIALFTLTVLEIVLGIDNLVVISILCDKLPKQKQALARRLGLIVALVTRILFLSIAFFIAHLEQSLFTIFDHDISWRDILLIFGGLFLMGKATTEIYERIEDAQSDGTVLSAVKASFAAIMVQIAFMDIVFSFDSVMTAIGMAEHLPVMIAAVLISVFIMIAAIEPINKILERHPSLKILALSFLILIGVALIGEGLEMHIPKGYIYFAMAFSVGVELINIITRKKKT